MSKLFWRDFYGDRSKDFIEGAIAAINAFCTWKDGACYIGSPEIPAKQAIKEAKEGLGWRPEWDKK